VVEPLHLAGLDGDQPRCTAGVFHRLPRLGQLNLLDALLRDQERHGFAVNRHDPSFRVGDSRYPYPYPWG
jgi:hypothetical protein